jgi:hypothetical protein
MDDNFRKNILWNKELTEGHDAINFYGMKEKYSVNFRNQWHTDDSYEDNMGGAGFYFKLYYNFTIIIQCHSLRVSQGTKWNSW